jgi:hypothetical protein
MNKSKRTNKQQTQDAFDDARYHWEFLRRCDKYRNDFKAFSRKYGEEGPACGFEPEWIVRECRKIGEDPRVPTAGCFIDRLTKDKRKFRARWGIDPTHPASLYPPFLRERISWVSDHVQSLAQPADQQNSREITLSIDLRGPEAELMKYLRWRIRLEKRSRGFTSERMSRKRADMYEDYLRAFDLSKAGKSDLEIARDEIMLSRAKKKNIVMNDKRVLAYRNRAEFFITKVRKGTW